MNSQNKRLIVVMGESGAGKSSFINLFSPVERAVVSSEGSMEACTRRHKEHIFYHNNLEITMIDTVGFGHSVISGGSDANDDADDPQDDTEAGLFLCLRLTELSTKGQKVSGIVYVHDIQKERIVGPGQEGLKVLNNVFGVATMAKVTFLTTHWDGSPNRKLVQKEREIKEQLVPKLVKGSHLAAFERLDDICTTQESRADLAMEILMPTIANPLQENGQTIEELVNGKPPAQTVWGQHEVAKKEKEIQRNKRLGISTEQQEKDLNTFKSLGLEYAGDLGAGMMAKHGGDVEKGRISGITVFLIVEGARLAAEHFGGGNGGLIRRLRKQVYDNFQKKADIGAQISKELGLTPGIGGWIGAIIAGGESFAMGTNAITQVLEDEDLGFFTLTC